MSKYLSIFLKFYFQRKYEIYIIKILGLKVFFKTLHLRRKFELSQCEEALAANFT